MATIAVLGTMDTKSIEHAYVADLIRARGHTPLLIDVGTGSAPGVTPDITREEVAEAAGIALAEIIARRDRGECVAAMATAAPVMADRLYREQKIKGIISLGGTGGTAIASAAMRALPIGFPKLLVSTVASGNTAPYIGTRDITMMPSIVDVNGLNRISRTIFARAAGAICGMVETEINLQGEKPLIVASMFGNTTKCVNACVKQLEEAGYEVLVFHATGTGGKAMESLIDSGMVAGVLDITTTELADELVGGVLTAGPDRLSATARAKVPSIVTPGCLDMVNFGEPSSIDKKFAGRKFYPHNPQVTLLRTTPEECKQLGRMVAEKVNQYSAPTTVLFPTRAISVISASGGAFHDPSADQALLDSLKQQLRPEIPLEVLDVEINDEAFADACVKALLRNMGH